MNPKVKKYSKFWTPKAPWCPLLIYRKNIAQPWLSRVRGGCLLKLSEQLRRKSIRQATKRPKVILKMLFRSKAAQMKKLFIGQGTLKAGSYGQVVRRKRSLNMWISAWDFPKKYVWNSSNVKKCSLVWWN